MTKKINFAVVGTFFLSNMLFNNAYTQEKKENGIWRKKAFNWIYHAKHWSKAEGVPLSGPGSTVEATTTLRVLLPAILSVIQAGSILDAGCGDFTWMQHMDLNKLNIKTYIGIDIAKSVINTNSEKHANDICSFYCKDIVTDSLPQVDIIICRDCLAHLSNEDIIAAIKNFKKSGARYLLASTYPKVKVNQNIKSGNFRGVNLRAYPFNFPVPSMLFEEMSAEEEMIKWGKYIALWRLDDINL